MLKFTPFPTWIEYSDDMPDKVGGYAKTFYTRIRNKYRDKDKGIHKHEYLHVTQYYVVLILWLLACYAAALLAPQYADYAIALMPASLCLHPVPYTYIPAYKLACEVACYREQAKHYPNDRRPLFAKFIAEDYGLKISAADALKLLRGE